MTPTLPTEAEVLACADLLKARDEKAKEEGGDYLYRGPGDELSREAATMLSTFAEMLKVLKEVDEALIDLADNMDWGNDGLLALSVTPSIRAARSRTSSRPRDQEKGNG